MKAAVESDPSKARWLFWLAVAALGWFLIRPLSLEWRINPQYSYGWIVPALALYLVAERWRDRPAPGQGNVRTSAFISLLILLALVRVVQEANPDWRLTNWIAALAVVAIVGLGFEAAGGLVWRRHFAFAIAFLLTAVPWPTPLENILVQKLMQWVAGIGVEVLNWMGIAAEHEGNLIRLGNGTLGVDEACSGIRSFQATIMVSLFLGELYRLFPRRRVGLVILGVVFALALNLARAIGLAILAAKNGVAAIDRWHDPAGYLLLMITFGCLLFTARFLSAKQAGVDENRWLGPNPASLKSLGTLALTALLVLGASEIATVTWYRSHEVALTRRSPWKVSWPAEDPNLLAIPIPESIRLVLRFNKGEAVRWDRRDGSRWHLYFFSWKPGRSAAILARSHRPETCLPSTGFAFSRTRGVQILRARGIELPIERIEFKRAGERLHVYYCLWEDRDNPGGDGPSLLTRENRLRAVMEGRRHLGQRVLEVVIAGIDSPERADAEFAEALHKWIIVDKP